MEKADVYARKGSMHDGQVNVFAGFNIYTIIKACRAIKISWLAMYF